MLCGKTPQGTRRDTCFKIKHFLIWLLHFVTKHSCSFSTVTVSVSQPLDWDQKMTLALLFMAVHQDYLYDMEKHVTYQRIYAHVVQFQNFLKSAAAFLNNNKLYYTKITNFPSLLLEGLLK